MSYKTEIVFPNFTGLFKEIAEKATIGRGVLISRDIDDDGDVVQYRYLKIVYSLGYKTVCVDTYEDESEQKRPYDSLGKAYVNWGCIPAEVSRIIACGNIPANRWQSYSRENTPWENYTLRSSYERDILRIETCNKAKKAEIEFNNAKKAYEDACKALAQIAQI